MAFVSVSLVKRLVAIQVCVILMMGSFDSAQPLGGLDTDLDAQTPATQPQPPLRSTRSRIAVQGVVFCKSCNSHGFNPFDGASPLPGNSEKISYTMKACIVLYVHKYKLG